MAKRKPSKAAVDEPKKTERSQHNPFVLAAPVSERVIIEFILISECLASRTPDADTDSPDMETLYEIKNIGVSADTEGGVIAIAPNFSLRIAPKGTPNAQPILKVECEIVVQYKCSSFDGIEEENIQAFAQTNGIFNAWPYWREFAQSMTSRMGLKPVLIPLFRFSRPPAKPSPAR